LDSEAKDEAFEKLKSLSTIEDGKMWWSDIKEDTSDKEEISYIRPISTAADVEMTAYALMTLVKRNEIEMAMSVFKWLVSKQNSKGGFSSTQDTVIGLQALAQLAGRLATDSINLNISALDKERDGQKLVELNLNDENLLLLQEAKLSRAARSVDIEATGHGFGIAQVSWQYNELDGKRTNGEPFQVNVTIINPPVNKGNNIEIKACSKYNPEGEIGMSVLEVELPSGYTANRDFIDNEVRPQRLKRVEYENSDTKVVFYFDQMTTDAVCVSVFAIRAHKVAGNKPIPVIIYNYYDPNERSIIFYEPPSMSDCDLCENEVDCEDICSNGAGLVGPSADPLNVLAANR